MCWNVERSALAEASVMERKHVGDNEKLLAIGFENCTLSMLWNAH
jgi:hypothetical protein